MQYCDIIVAHDICVGHLPYDSATEKSMVVINLQAKTG